MALEIPDDRRYTDSHEWVKAVDGTLRIGITDLAQDELGDIVFLELPAVDDGITAGEPFGLIESIKAISDLYAPVSGTVKAVNNAVDNAPETINEDPYGEGWLIEIESDESIETLMDAEAYRSHVE